MWSVPYNKGVSLSAFSDRFELVVAWVVSSGVVGGALVLLSLLPSVLRLALADACADDESFSLLLRLTLFVVGSVLEGNVVVDDSCTVVDGTALLDSSWSLLSLSTNVSKGGVGCDSLEVVAAMVVVVVVVAVVAIAFGDDVVGCCCGLEIDGTTPSFSFSFFEL